MLQAFFIVEYGITCFLCIMHVFEVRVSTFVPNFVSVAASVAELAHGEEIAYSINQSLNHSLTHPAYLMPQEPKRLCFRINTLIIRML